MSNSKNRKKRNKVIKYTISKIVLKTGSFLITLLGKLWNNLPNFASLIISIIALIAAYYSFSPNLTIEAVNRGEYNTHSRLIVRNIGMVTAYNISANGFKINYKKNGFRSENNALIYTEGQTLELAPNETMEVQVCEGFSGRAEFGESYEYCDYYLVLEYEFNKLFYSKKLYKQWKIELLNADKDFDWSTSLRGFITKNEVEELRPNQNKSES